MTPGAIRNHRQWRYRGSACCVWVPAWGTGRAYHWSTYGHGHTGRGCQDDWWAAVESAEASARAFSWMAQAANGAPPQE